MRYAQLSGLEYFALLVSRDEDLQVLEAAIAIAQDEVPGLDPQAVLHEIDGLAARLKRRLAADAPALQKLRLLNRYFFHELGFAGNVNDYYDPANSYLHEVLRRRRGIPISLALLYLEFAQQIGLSAHGVAFPGHFLVKLRVGLGEGAGEVVMDPFSGQSLSSEQLDERLAPYRRRHGLVGDFEVPLGLFLQAASGRDVLARLLRNLKEIHRQARDWRRMLAVQQRLVLLLPGSPEERRDRGLVYAELGEGAAAAQDLSHYLGERPVAEDAAALLDRLAGLRQAGRPRLH